MKASNITTLRITPRTHESNITTIEVALHQAVDNESRKVVNIYKEWQILTLWIGYLTYSLPSQVWVNACTIFKDIFLFLLKSIIIKSHVCYLFAGVDLFLFFSFFFLLNCAVSSLYSSRDDSDVRFICCLDKKNTTWVGNELIASSKDISDHWNDQRIGSRITPVFDKVNCHIVPQPG